MVKQKFSGGQRFCDGEKFFGASGDAPFGFSACFRLASFSQPPTSVGGQTRGETSAEPKTKANGD
jgi:hypothetical protein